MTACQNCSSPHGQAGSLDMDLPTVTLCDMCWFLIVSDRGMFNEAGGRKADEDP